MPVLKTDWAKLQNALLGDHPQVFLGKSVKMSYWMEVTIHKCGCE